MKTIGGLLETHIYTQKPFDKDGKISENSFTTMKTIGLAILAVVAACLLSLLIAYLFMWNYAIVSTIVSILLIIGSLLGLAFFVTYID